MKEGRIELEGERRPAISIDIKGKLTGNSASVVSSLYREELFEPISSGIFSDEEESWLGNSSIVDTLNDEEFRVDISRNKIIISSSGSLPPYETFRDYMLYLEETIL